MAFVVERVAALRPRQTEARGREKLFARRTERGRWRPASMVCHSRVNGNSGLLCMHSIRFPSGGRFVPGRAIGFHCLDSMGIWVGCGAGGDWESHWFEVRGSKFGGPREPESLCYWS